MQNYNKLSQSQFDYSIQTIKNYPRLIVLFLYGTFLEVRHLHLHLLEPRGWVLYPSHLLPLQFYDLLSNEQQEKKFSTVHSLFRSISHRRYFQCFFFRREKASAKKAWSARHAHAMRKGKQRTTGASYRWLYTFKQPGILFCNTPWVLCLTNLSINSVALCCSINNMIMELSGVRCGL